MFIAVMCCSITGLTATVCDAEEVYGDVYVATGEKLQVSGRGMDVYGSVFNRGIVSIDPFKWLWQVD